MSAPKMYYAVVDAVTYRVISIESDKEVANSFDSFYHIVIPIPAHEIDNLIKKYRK